MHLEHRTSFARRLRALKRRGLIACVRSIDDGRQSHIWLTRKGQQTFAPLNARAREEVARMIEKLSAVDQRRLFTAMETIMRLLDSTEKGDPSTQTQKPNRPH
jgi:DNA-binding MarR family transcriptional regulator